MGPLIVGGFALLGVLGTTQTWARVFVVTLAGTDADRGLIALACLLGVMTLAGLRAFRGLGNGWYFGAGLVLSVIALTMALWFVIEIETTEVEEGLFAGADFYATGNGAYLTIVGAMGAGLALAIQGMRSRSIAIPIPGTHEDPVEDERPRYVRHDDN